MYPLYKDHSRFLYLSFNGKASLSIEILIFFAIPSLLEIFSLLEYCTCFGALLVWNDVLLYFSNPTYLYFMKYGQTVSWQVYNRLTRVYGAGKTPILLRVQIGCTIWRIPTGSLKLCEHCFSVLQARA